MITIVSSSFMEGKEQKAGGAVVDCSSPWTVPTDAATALFPSCHFTGVAGEALPAARAAVAGCAPWPRRCHRWPGVPCIPGGTTTTSCAPRPQEYHRRRGNRERLKGQDQPWRLFYLGYLFPIWILGIKWGSFWSAILWFLLVSPLCR